MAVAFGRSSSKNGTNDASAQIMCYAIEVMVPLETYDPNSLQLGAKNYKPIIYQ